MSRYEIYECDDEGTCYPHLEAASQTQIVNYARGIASGRIVRGWSNEKFDIKNFEVIDGENENLTPLSNWL